LAEFSAKRGFRVVEAVQETGSGWNGSPPKLFSRNALQSNPHFAGNY
jgi:hypothetical protein